jgi:hypothetical protein
MRYRVMFMERTNAAGDPSEDPTAYLIPELESGVVREALFIERDKPAVMHSEEQLEEDDDFLSVGSEVWEYDVADGRDRDFTDALRNSQMVLDYEVIDDVTERDAPP